MKTIPTLSFTEALRLGWKNKFNCAGRARRSEFWWNVLMLGVVFVICNIMMSIVTVIISISLSLSLDTIYDSDADYSDVYLWIALQALLLLFALVFYYPLLVRRLHDVGKSGRWAIVQILFGWTLPITLPFSYMAVKFVLEENRFPFVRKGVQNLWDCLADFLFYGSPFCVIIGVVITIYLCVFCVRDGQKEENQYGPSPKYQS